MQEKINEIKSKIVDLIYDSIVVSKNKPSLQGACEIIRTLNSFGFQDTISDSIQELKDLYLIINKKPSEEEVNEDTL